MMDICAVISATAMVFASFEKRMFFDCEKGSECFKDALLTLVEVYTKQVLCPSSDTVWSNKATEESKAFLKELAALA